MVTKVVSWSVWAAITETGWFINNWNLILIILQSGKSKIRVLAGSGENPVPGCREPTSPYNLTWL